MTKKTRYRSAGMASIHDAAKSLRKVKAIDKATMRVFDKMCLTPIRALTGAQIRALREREHASQSVFAAHLNVSKGLVSQWERDEKRPAGPSLKLLTLVAKNGLSAIA